VLAVLAVLLVGCEPLGPDELRRETQAIHSLAAEGSVLADRVAEQETKRTFARVQARELGDAADHSAERLTDARPQEDLVEPTERAIALAERVADEIGGVEVAPDDAASARIAAERLRSLATRADQLAGSL
jgi:hypothetical protein